MSASQLLIKYLEDIAICEQDMEYQRQSLSLIPSFEPKTAFNHLDLEKRDCIREVDIKHLLNQYNFPVDKEEIRKLISYFDYDQDLKISYDDFIQRFLPRQNDKIKQEAIKRSSYSLADGEQMDQQVQDQIFQVLTQEMRNIRLIENMKNSFIQLKYDCFQLITENTHIISFLDFQKFFKSNKGNSFDEIRIFSLMDRVGTQDGVTYEQFSKIINDCRPKKNPSVHAQIRKKREVSNNGVSPIKVQKDIIYLILQQMILFCQQQEATKQQLATQDDFNLLDSFRIIDIQEKGSVSAQELHDAMVVMNIPCTCDDIDLIFKNFLLNPEVDYLKYSQFTTLILANNNKYFNILNSKEPKYIVEMTFDMFCINTQQLIRQLFINLILYLKELNKMKQQISCTQNFNIESAYRTIDSQEKGYICKTDLERLLNQQECTFRPIDVNNLIKLFTAQENITKQDFYRKLQINQ